MKKDRKINKQGTGKEENRVDNIRPDQGETAGTDNMANIGVSALLQGDKDLNEGNQVTADKPVRKGGKTRGKTDALNNNNTTNNYKDEVDVNTGGVRLDKSPGATNKGNNPSNADLATTSTATDTGKRASGTSKKKTTLKQSPSISRIYGKVETSDNSFFIEQGNVPQGKLQLLPPQEIADQMKEYNGQFISATGTFTKKNKGDKFATFSIQKIASHDEIGRRAYELSHQNPSSKEDNWYKAESELLQ